MQSQSKIAKTIIVVFMTLTFVACSRAEKDNRVLAPGGAEIFDDEGFIPAPDEDAVIDEGFIPAPDEDAVIDEASIPIPPGMEIDENLTPTLGGEVTPPDNIDGAKVINPGTIPIPNPNEGTNEAEISEEMNFPPSDEV